MLVLKRHRNSYVKIGEKLIVKVLKIDPIRQRVFFALADATAPNWDQIRSWAYDRETIEINNGECEFSFKNITPTTAMISLDCPDHIQITRGEAKKRTV